MEEVGLLGARQIAYTLKPDVALVVDVTHATDYPTVNQQQHGDVKVGQGPTLTHGVCNHPEVVARLESGGARRRRSSCSTRPPPRHGTDTDVIFWTRGGIPSALVSLPEPLHALAGGGGQFAGLGTDSAVDVRPSRCRSRRARNSK